jgi:DNA gyrase subunit B
MPHDDARAALNNLVSLFAANSTAQLCDTTMDPAQRNLIQVHLDDTVEAERIFTTLMGEVVAPRREFIEENALLVSNLDV